MFKRSELKFWISENICKNRRDFPCPCMLYCGHLVYITTIVNAFYGGISWVWVCKIGKKVGTMTKGENSEFQKKSKFRYIQSV